MYKIFRFFLFAATIGLSFQSVAVTSLQSASYSSSNTGIGKIDLVVVDKSKSSMSLMRNGQILRKYRIAMGDSPVGHKVTEGDQRTPEGRYILDYKKSDSAYYRAIHISYPNEEDKLRASALGLSPGGQIMIHGQNPNSSLPPEEAQQYNWTDGCIAITNAQMDELWRAIDEGTPIEIWP
ncbi:L,D-transpeptidase family protein [uncultured Shewanella sp.]|uniref:L,D-transpeptidase family protein n=1 Tax=uncultured Shewanella sp. TaxID=173975 RepID=UPI00262BDA73|nr:L,D-transpeptidase family protein [uncultured Shewanella sp.]